MMPTRLWVLAAAAIFTLVAANSAWIFPALSELIANTYVLHRAVADDLRSQVSFFLRTGGDKTSLESIVKKFDAGEESSAYIVNEKGFIIAHTDIAIVGKNVLDREVAKKALAGEEADSRSDKAAYVNEKNEKVFAVALPLKDEGLVIVVESPRRTALAQAQRILNVAIITFILEVVLVLLLVWNYSNLTKTAALFYGERNQRESLLNNLADGVVEYDANSKVVLMNPRAEELLGIKFKDIEGIEITPSLPKANPNTQALVEIIYPALATFASSPKDIPGSRSRVMEIHTSRPELRVLVTLSQITDQAGSVHRFLKILHDVSRDRLLARIKSEFVSIAAHQLRTPLSAIKWTLKLLIEGDAGQLTPEQKDFVEKGYVTNERMIKLVNDLLNAARIEEGRFGYEFKETSLVEFLESVVVNSQTNAQSKGVNLNFEKAVDDLPNIYTDPEKLSLAVTNLVDNALKYTARGGAVKLRLERSGDFAVVSVSDNGVGIPEAEQKRVFTKFFRASNVMRMETEGTGLGLFIVRNIVKRHGGEIQFFSEVGKGTTFTFTLPIKREGIPVEEQPPLEEFLATI